MGIKTMRVVEYSLECDTCDDWEILHTGEVVDGVFVHTIQSVIKACKYHRTKKGLVCDNCFKKMKGNIRGVE